MNRGIGDILEYGMKSGEDAMNKKLSQKYGVNLSKFEEDEVIINHLY